MLAITLGCGPARAHLEATGEGCRRAGIDVVSSEYATIAAENTALENLTKQVADRIVTRIALTLRAGIK